MADESPQNLDNTPVLQIIKQINNGILDPKNLAKDIRQDCIEHLWYVEAQPVAFMAHLFQVSDKTIRRDQEEIRARRAKATSADYSDVVFGELFEKARAVHENMQRLSRSPDASVQEKAQAGYYTWKIIEQLIEKAQSTGIAPSQGIKIDATIRKEEEKSPQQLKEELARLEAIVNGKGNVDPKVQQLIETTKGQIALAEAKLGLKELKDIIEKGQGTA